MNLGQNKATLIKTKIEAGMATEADKKWLKKWNKKKLKIKQVSCRPEASSQPNTYFEFNDNYN